uniref:phytol kinase n=1 Tax=Tetradesmus obliquus TaxID=3088 RepID=A0A383WKL8_TETOB|eukprot:jgi/Sobl393_1/11164/SZX78008.1
MLVPTQRMLEAMLQPETASCVTAKSCAQKCINCSALALCAWLEPLEGSEREAQTANLERMLAGTDFIPLLVGNCRASAAELQQHAAAPAATSRSEQEHSAQPQQAQHMVSEHAQELAKQMHTLFDTSQYVQYLWNCLVSYLPGSSSTLALLLPGAALPLALLRTRLQPEPALVDGLAAAHKLGSSAEAANFYTKLRTTAVEQGVVAAHYLAAIHMKRADAQCKQQPQQQLQKEQEHRKGDEQQQRQQQELDPGKKDKEQQQQQQGGDRQPKEQLAAAVQAWASGDVQQLQLAFLAIGAEHLHHEKQGLANASARTSIRTGVQQQLGCLNAVPPLHRQLLAALGMPVDDVQREQAMLKGWAAVRAKNAMAEIIAWGSALHDDMFPATHPQLSVLELAANILEKEQGHCSGRRSRSSSSGSCGAPSSMSSCSCSCGSSSSHMLGAQHAAALLAVIELQLLHADDVTPAVSMLPTLLAVLMRSIAHLAQQPALLRQVLTATVQLMFPFLQRSFGQPRRQAAAAAAEMDKAANSAAAAEAAQAECLASVVWKDCSQFLLLLLNTGAYSEDCIQAGEHPAPTASATAAAEGLTGNMQPELVSAQPAHIIAAAAAPAPASAGTGQLLLDVFSQQPGLSSFALQAAVRTLVRHELEEASKVASNSSADQRQRNVFEATDCACRHAAVAVGWLTSNQLQQQATNNNQQRTGTQPVVAAGAAAGSTPATDPSAVSKTTATAKTGADHAAVFTMLLSAFKAQVAAAAATAAEPCTQHNEGDSSGSELHTWQLLRRLELGVGLACRVVHGVCGAADAAASSSIAAGSSSNSSSSGGGSTRTTETAAAAAAVVDAAIANTKLSQQLQWLLQHCRSALHSLLRICQESKRDETLQQCQDTQQQQDQQLQTGRQQRESAAAGKQQLDLDAPVVTTLKLAKRLQQLGAAVISRLPLPYCCSNPRCSNLGGLSEQELVAGKASRCSGCKVARYCSRQCQAEHWEAPAGHKAVCKRLRAAAAGAG